MLNSDIHVLVCIVLVYIRSYKTIEIYWSSCECFCVYIYVETYIKWIAFGRVHICILRMCRTREQNLIPFVCRCVYTASCILYERAQYTHTQYQCASRVKRMNVYSIPYLHSMTDDSVVQGNKHRILHGPFLTHTFSDSIRLLLFMYNGHVF